MNSPCTVRFLFMAPGPTRPAWQFSRAGRLALACLAIATAVRAAEREAVVAVAPVTRQDLSKDLTVQAELRPFQEVDLHSKIAGYLKTISVEIGDHVKKGDVLAVLEVPEMRGDLARAEAAVRRAEANAREASLNYSRLASVSRGQPNLLAQQELDLAQSRDISAAASVAEARADLEKSRALEQYTRIVAPFDGVITKRFADAGALIQAGTASNTQAMPLVRLSQDDKLRLVFPVSVSYARTLKVGDPIEIDVGERVPRLRATIARFNRRISTETRTMLGETDVSNADLSLIPGMYVTVVLKLEQRPAALAVPVEAVAGTTRPTVFLITAEHRIEERAVKLGLQTPTKYEVVSGLKEGDLVMIGSRAHVQAGQQVTTKAVNLVAGP